MAMTLTIDLEPEMEKRLRELARQHGLDEIEFVRRLIKQHLPAIEANEKSLWDTLTPEEWVRETTEWAQGHDTSIPLLSDEAVSRESFYEGRP
jgi:predicted transcriptional regulator